MKGDSIMYYKWSILQINNDAMNIYSALKNMYTQIPLLFYVNFL